jgi:hypothetical protein
VPQRQRQKTDQNVRFHPLGLLMKDGAQQQVALANPKGGLGLLQLQIPIPEFRRVGFQAVGAQQVRTVRPPGPLAALQATGQPQPASSPGLIDCHAHFKEFVGRGITPKSPPDAPFDRRPIGVGFLAQAGIQLEQLRQQPLFLPDQHRLLVTAGMKGAFVGRWERVVFFASS